jgi:hypothetical protein
MMLCEGGFFPLSEQEKRYNKIRDFVTPFLDRDLEEKPLSDDELKRLEVNIQTVIKKLLPTLIQLSEDDSRIVSFLKKELSMQFWDEELRKLPTSLFMPKNLTEKKPIAGLHSLDAIWGYYYSFKAMGVNKENDEVESNFNKAKQYQSFYALAYFLNKRIEGKTQEKKMLLKKIEELNYLYGTPGYVYSAYILLLYAEKNKKIAHALSYVAEIYLNTAEQLQPFCKPSINNLEHTSLQMGECVFKSFDDVFKHCKEVTAASLSSLDVVKANIEAADEIERFWQNGNFNPPSPSNVYYIVK